MTQFFKHSSHRFVLLIFLFMPNSSLDATNENRANLTISCRDCDYIPKVPNAGQVINENNIAVQIMHNGIKVTHGGYHGEWMSKIIQELRGHHEPQEEKVFYETLKTIPSNATMIELGSSWSYYSIWFNYTISNPTNYMIEPNFKKLILGKRNFKLNNMNGFFYNAFIGKTSIEDSFFTDWDNKKWKIPQICVDDFVKKNNITFVHILHSDIQGAEYDMLQGCEQTIDNNMIGYLFISTHGNLHEKCLNYIKNKNFQIIAEHSPEESYSGDGLIVGRHKNFSGLDYIEISKNK